MIFEDSCYGRQLISALLESKAIEERDLQKEFQKKIAEKAKKLKQKAIGDCIQNSIDMSNKEKELIIRERETAKCMAEMNKKMYLIKLENKIQEQERQKQERKEIIVIMKKMIDQEAAEDEHKKRLQKEELEQFIADHRKVIENREKREKEDERRTKQWQEYEQKRNSKISVIQRKRFDIPQLTENYELIKKLKEEEKSRYDEFINKGIMKLNNEIIKQDMNDNIKRENELKNNNLLMRLNKELAEQKQFERYQNKCACDRQTIILKSKNPFKIKADFDQDATTSASTNAIVLKNERTEDERPHWSGLSAAHAQFAQHASDTLQMCKYKNMARKVVDEYRRLNCLDPQSLPVANYD